MLQATRIKNGILRQAELTEDFINAIMRPQWIGELYRMIYGGAGGFYNAALGQTLGRCQMILLRRYDDATYFITSDNPVFKHVSAVEIENGNGIYFPLSPDYLLFVAKGNEGIDRVGFRLADTDTVRMFNNKIYNHSYNKVVSRQRGLMV